ncbi:hypothetical protein Q9966_016736 [Columba livia]|nr:hypothetical protein Q9966_016736 [Columba livia]
MGPVHYSWRPARSRGSREAATVMTAATTRGRCSGWNSGTRRPRRRWPGSWRRCRPGRGPRGCCCWTGWSGTWGGAPGAPARLAALLLEAARSPGPPRPPAQVVASLLLPPPRPARPARPAPLLPRRVPPAARGPPPPPRLPHPPRGPRPPLAPPLRPPGVAPCDPRGRGQRGGRGHRARAGRRRGPGLGLSSAVTHPPRVLGGTRTPGGCGDIEVTHTAWVMGTLAATQG